MTYSGASHNENTEDQGYVDHGNYIGNKGPLFGTRHVQILLLAFCLMIGIAMRASLAVQIVAMTSKNSTSPNPNIPTYHWDNSSIVLSSFFWAYVVVNIFAAPLEKKYGAKWFLFGAIFLNSLTFALIPPAAANSGATGVIVCRILQGMGQGFMFPTQQVILGLWAPTEERARANIAVTTGTTIGLMMSSGLSGILASSWWGWPSSFYLFGAMGFLWCIFYLFLGQNSPATHPRITPEEKIYIQMSLNQQQQVEVPIPWKGIFTSVPVWGNLVAQIGVAWTVNMSMTEYSTYLDKIMHFDIKSNGLYISIPPALALIAGLIFGPLSDYAISRQYISTANCRRIFHVSGGFCIAICLICLSYLDESRKMLSVLIMIFVYISQAALTCGNGVNMVDLSPRFAGVIYGLLNSTSQGIALFAPLLVQFVVTGDQTDPNQWRIVFITTAAIMVATSVTFAIFASGERQPWDAPKETNFVEENKTDSIKSVSGSLEASKMR